jgi:exopolysaccharide biosynthesis polyprenyl glycosylphosphotransferase
MFEQRSGQLRRVTAVLDVAVTIGAFLTAYWLREMFLGQHPADLFSHVALLPFITVAWTFLLIVFGAYASPSKASPLDYAWAATRSVATGLAVLLALLFLLKGEYVSRAIVVAFAVLDLTGLIAVRLGVVWYFRRMLAGERGVRRVLIIGSGPRADRLAEALLKKSEWGVDIVGHLDPDPTRIDHRVLGSPVLGTIDDITSVLKDHVVDEVILAVPRAMIPQLGKVASVCEEEGVKLRLMADVFDVEVARMDLVEFGRIPLLTLEPVFQEEWKLLVKRMIDIALTGVTLPVVLPILGLVALAIKLDSPGPVFFRQDRVGLNRRRFRMLKFRSMVVGAERMQAELEHLNEAQGPIFKIRKDPRITRVGRILRRTSLDELPQIIHVLRGEMSLVGPRPMSLRDVNLFDRGIQRKRFSVKPGLTCLWQISGRSNLPFSRWLELDLQYIKQWSLGLDLRILFRTIPVVLKGTGAT